jgi:hypothetical protein
VTFTDTGTPPVTKTVSYNFQTAYYRGPDGNLYQMVWTPWGSTWDEAFSASQQRPFLGRFGRLVTIESAQEDAFVERVRRTSFPAQNIEEVWAGGLQRGRPATPQDQWFWITGQPIPGMNGGSTYANWLPFEPNDFFGFDSENFLTLGLGGKFGWNDNGNFGSTRLQAYMVEYFPFFVWLDVKPNELENKIQLNSQGKIPVAIMGTNSFDVRQFDLGSITAGRNGNEARPVSTEITDVNADGFMDLLMHFNTQDLDLGCGDSSVTLLGNDRNGGPFRGRDRVELIGCPPYSLAFTALQDVFGRTEVALEVKTILPGFSAPATMDHLNLRSYDMGGGLRWTENFHGIGLSVNGNSSFGRVFVEGVAHRQPIRAKAQVPNSRVGSTEIVQADGVVLFRPDLAVTAVRAPAQVNVRQQVAVVAEIAELNGDLGATFTAFLMENGRVLDARTNVVIGPGTNAAVVFSLALPTEGQHNLRVLLSHAVPSDFDLSNNHHDFVVEAVRPALEPALTQLQYSYNLAEGVFVEENEFTIFRRSYFNKGENFFQTLYIPGQLRFPLSSAAITISTDGSERSHLEAMNIPVTFVWTNECFMQLFGFAPLDESSSITVQVDKDNCSGFAQSYVTISRFAYDNTFFSAEYSRTTGEQLWENSGQFGQGTFLLPSVNVSTRFVATDAMGTFGGNAGIASLFDDFWRGDFDYVTPWRTHVSGFDSVQSKFGFNFQMTEP